MIGFAGGEVPQIPANILLVKNVDVIGFYWGAYATLDKAAFRQSMEALLRSTKTAASARISAGGFPFGEAREAFDLLKSRKAAGKIVLTPS